MIRKYRFFLFFFIFLTGSLRAAPSELAGFLKIDDSGVFQVDNLTFRMTSANAQWAWFTQSAASVKAAAGFPRRSEKEFALRGVWTVNGSPFALDQKISAAGRFRANYSLELEAAEPVPVNELALHVLFPAKGSAADTILVDGRPAGFGREFDDSVKPYHVRQAKSVKFQLAHGELELNGNLHIQVQDNRGWDSDEWEVRVRPELHIGDISKTKLSLTLDYRPFPQHTLDLRSGSGATGFSDGFRFLPSGRQVFSGITFDILPSASGGGNIAALRGPKQPNLPERLEIVCDGTAERYLYLLHAVSEEADDATEVGTVTVEYANNAFVDQSTRTFIIRSGTDVGSFRNVRDLPGAAAGWEYGGPDFSAGLYVSRFDLGGAAIRKITFDSSGKAVWMIAGATLSDKSMNLGGGDRAVVMRASKEWLPFENRRNIPKGNILDFSDLLDAPAGKYGLVRAAGDHFEFTDRPGIPARFYGANICFDVNYMPKHLADRMADDFAATGYNLVRLHHHDRDLVDPADSVTLRPERIDRLDYTVAAFKKRGIYVTLDLLILRALPKKIMDAYPDATPNKALVFIDENAMKDFEVFSANFLNHVNPYTGLAWKEEPAIMGISILNEGTLLFALRSSPWLEKLYREKFNVWLVEKGFSVTTATREGLWRRFLGEVYAAGHARMTNYLRNLGVKVLLTDQNVLSANSVAVLREAQDYVDNHFYWSHPQFLGANWTLPTVASADSAITHYAGGVNTMFPSRLLNKPFSVSEWNYCRPNPHRMEGAFLFGAYAALQDWGMTARFTYSHYPENVENEAGPLTGAFDMVTDSLGLLSERAAVLMFLRGDVKKASGVYPFLLNRRHNENPAANDSPPITMRRLGLVGRTGTLLADPGEAPEFPAHTRAAVTQENVWTFSDDTPQILFSRGVNSDLTELLKSGAVPADSVDLEAGRFTSDTGELELHRSNGTFKAVTPRSEAFVLGAKQSLSGAFARIANEGAFAAFLVAARDDRPLDRSERILLLHLTDSRNTGMTFRNAELTILEKVGTLPVLARKGAAEVTLNASLDNYRLFALDLNGARREEIPLVREGNCCRFHLKMVYGGEPRFAYELVRE